MKAQPVTVDDRMPMFRARRAAWFRTRRAARRAEGRCVNDTVARTHGSPVKSNRCEHCNYIHTLKRGTGHALTRGDS